MSLTETELRHVQPREEGSSRREEVPAFADLVRAKSKGDDKGFRDLLERFEADQGPIIDSYWCHSPPGGVALTEMRPSLLLRALGRGNETRLHRMTEQLVRDEPEFARLLLNSDRQSIRVANVLSGMSRRIALFTLFASTRQILTFLEGYLRKKEEAAEQTPAEREALKREALDTLHVNERIQKESYSYYHQAAAREAQIVYLVGMLKGFVALVVGAVALAWLFGSLDVPGVDPTTFLGCLIAGGVGAVVSVLTRMNSDKFNVNHEIGREYLSRLGAFRPTIGAVFALLMYFALQGSLFENIRVPAENPEQFAWFLAVGFLLGFSERLAKEMLGSAETSLGFGGDSNITPSATRAPQ